MTGSLNCGSRLSALGGLGGWPGEEPLALPLTTPQAVATGTDTGTHTDTVSGGCALRRPGREEADVSFRGSEMSEARVGIFRRRAGAGHFAGTADPHARRPAAGACGM